MGFEQLAALKEQLAAQNKPTPPAPKKAPRQAPKHGAVKASEKKPSLPEKTVDPVVMSISRLQRLFPNAFPKNPAPKVPLKLGTYNDLLLHTKELNLDEAQIKLAVKTWCEGRRYWACMVEGVPRLDLLGAAAGVVTASDAARAKHLSSRANGKANQARNRPKAKQVSEQPAATSEDTPKVDQDDLKSQ
jgi:ProP effector